MRDYAQVTQGGDLIAEGKISVVHQKEAPKPTAEETSPAETSADAEAKPTEVIEHQQAWSPLSFANFPLHQSTTGEPLSPSHHNLSHCSIL